MNGMALPLQLTPCWILRTLRNDGYMESYSDHNYVFGYAAAMETKATKQNTMAELLYALEDK